MINKSSIYLFILLLHTLNSSNWYFQNDNPWELNTSSRSSALGGIYLENFDISQEGKTSAYKNNKIKVYSSSMYDNLIKYNNIFYTHKLNFLALGNKIKFIRIGLLNRRIDNISNTTGIWSDEFNPPSTPADLNDGSIGYYSHNDFSGSIFIPLQGLWEGLIINHSGQVALNIKPGFSKIGSDSFKSLNVDISFLYPFNNNKASIGLVINNFFSYKIWNTNTIERFYPSLSVLMNYKTKKINCFLQINNFYLDSDYIKNQYYINDNINMGLEYSAYKNLHIRCGYNKKYSSIGLGMNLYNIRFDYAYLNHQYLGNSSQLSATFLIKK